MSRCQCATERRPAVTDATGAKKFQWGGCSDNVKHGKRVARNFLELQPIDTEGDEISEILRHDGEVGIATVASHMENKCKCHGKKMIFFSLSLLICQHLIWCIQLLKLLQVFRGVAR
jgi:wingless-type MMTV integration site family protein 9